MTGFAVDRHEWKYLVSRKEHRILSGLLAGVFDADPHAGSEGTYPVRSLYFDTPDQYGYHSKIDGLSDRHKVRLRLYDVTQTKVKLELKAKSGNVMRKETLWITRHDAEQLCRGETDFLADLEAGNAGALYRAIKRETLRPVTLVEYDREAYICSAQSIRINFDLNVRATSSCLDLFHEEPAFTRLSDKEDIVLEVKHPGHLPDFLRSLLSVCDPVRTSYSKYCIARERIF